MKKKLPVIILVVLIILLVSTILIHNNYLKISNLKSGEIYLYEFSNNGKFSISYIHSYDKTKVIEKFSIDKKQNIIPIEVLYSADTYDIRKSRYPNSKIEINNNYIRIFDIELKNYDHFKKLLINIKNYEPQYLTIQTNKIIVKDYSFLNFGEKGDLLKIKIVNISLLSYLIERSF